MATRVFTNFGKYVKVAFSSKYLLYTNVTISLGLSGVGDVLEQNYEIFKEELPSWDQRRTLNMSISGVTIGMLCHGYYKYLDKRWPGTSMKMVMGKLVVDQLVCSPLVIGTFFITLAILEQSSMENFIEEVKQKAWRLYVAEWIVWPPAQFINFYFLPTKYRVLYDSTISLGYDVYTSYVKNYLPLEKSESQDDVSS